MNDTNMTSGPVMNSPAETLRQETGRQPLRGQQTEMPRADDSTELSSRPEARPVTLTAHCIEGMPHRGFYFCTVCGKDLTPEIPWADAPGRVMGP